ncbi:MAG: OB-fold nucleic acid binding domain-containing protein, partial [Acidithiobacillus ferrooxidans]|nr:OB-fold nucleic acid binding domain-containing protein [Acidithiobacillus ferrooxidans]
MRTHYCNGIHEGLIGQTVILCGWAQRRRDHGGVIFIDLRDREGLVQIVADPDQVDAFAAANECRSEFVLQVEGVLRARPAGTENPHMPSGKVELAAARIRILNRSEPVPF